MIVRAIDGTGDWVFGVGKNAYKRNINAVAQSVQTRLKSFLGDCFFSVDSGLDWFNLMGSKNRGLIVTNIKTTILNTPYITGLKDVSIVLDNARVLTVKYQVQTSFSESGIAGEFSYDFGTGA